MRQGQGESDICRSTSCMHINLLSAILHPCLLGSYGRTFLQSNQASTLDQTIQYMKSLQNHVQAMSMRPATAEYPVLLTPAASLAMPIPMPPAAIDPGTTVAPPARMVPMVPFGAMLGYPQPQYHSVMMPAAAAASLFQPAPTVSTDPLGTSRDRRQCSVSMEQQQHNEKGRKRS